MIYHKHLENVTLFQKRRSIVPRIFNVVFMVESIYNKVYHEHCIKMKFSLKDFLSKYNQMDFTVNKHRSKISQKFFEPLSVAKHVRTKIYDDPT